MSEIVNGNPLNNEEAVVPRNYSRFPQDEVVLDTHRFGEYHPHLVFEGYPKDNLPWRCVHDARSYTLKAPLMQDIQMHKDYFMVTQRGVLPFQAERVDKIPKIGDDVPSDAYCSVSQFVTKIKSVFESLYNEYSDTMQTVNDRTTYAIKALVFLESVFSRGSLLASLGCSLNACFNFQTSSGVDYGIDDVFDILFGDISTYLDSNNIECTIDGVYYRVVLNPSKTSSYKEICLRDFLQRVRDTADWELINFTDNNFINRLLAYSYNFVENNLPIDLIYPWSYHLACAEYFTEDQVDYIYSSNLFREYIHSLIVESGVNSQLDFTWNSLKLPYDYLSAHFFDRMINDFDATVLSSNPASFQYFLTLFGYHRSLRFRDYFVGSRTRPLAIDTQGVSQVPVVGGNVSVVNITKSIQGQRLLNAVMHAHSDWEGYIGAIFGDRPRQDMHEPIHLAHTVDKMFVAENENTGDAVYQDVNGNKTTENSVTGIFRGNSGNFAFQVSCDERCIIIGVTSYDIARAYPDMILRRFFVRDRYDMFLPQMQYIGDQPVYRHELFSGDLSSFGTAFGYQSNGMHWKQMINRACGAFGTDKLPGYAFVLERNEYGSSENLSPDFIRARNCELDKFYLSLTSYSLGHYFHFILKEVNICDSKRAMCKKPQIL